MGAVYSGGPITTGNFTGDSINAIVEGWRTKMLLSNWTDVSGGVGDRTMRSVATPQGLQCECRAYDNGGGATAARFRFRNVGGGITGNDMFFSPNLARVPTVRIIANPYQFFLFYPDVLNSLNTFAAGGCPSIEDFQAGLVSDCIWSQGNGPADAVGAFTAQSFREWGCNRYSNAGHWALYNNFECEGTGNIGCQRITYHQPVDNPANSSVSYPAVWGETMEAVKDPARIAWGPTGITVASRVFGPIWDAVAVGDAYPAGVQSTFDGHTFENITTDYWQNLNSPTNVKFSLWIAIT